MYSRRAAVLIVTGWALVAGAPAAAKDVQATTQAGLQPVLSSAAPLPIAAQGARPARRPDVPWVPSPPEVVSAMLRLVNVRAGDVVYDLGCGDARIPIAAAREFGAHAVGVELDPEVARAARENVRAAGLDDRVRIVQQDLFETDLSDATVVTLYLLSSLNLKVRPKLLRELRPGARVVSHAFDMGDWKPDQELTVTGPSFADAPEATIFSWVIPPRRGGKE